MGANRSASAELAGALQIITNGGHADWPTRGIDREIVHSADCRITWLLAGTCRKLKNQRSDSLNCRGSGPPAMSVTSSTAGICGPFGASAGG